MVAFSSHEECQDDTLVSSTRHWMDTGITDDARAVQEELIAQVSPQEMTSLWGLEISSEHW